MEYLSQRQSRGRKNLPGWSRWPWLLRHLNIWTFTTRHDLNERSHYPVIGRLVSERYEKKEKRKRNRRVEGFLVFWVGPFFFADLTYSQAYIYRERRGYDKCYPRISHIEELNGCRPGLCVASCKKGSMPDDTGECPHQPGCYMD